MPPPDQLTEAHRFPAVDHATWRGRVEAELGDASFDDALVHRTRDGLDLQPLYTAESLPAGFDARDLPGEAPFTRGCDADGGWRIAQEIAHAAVADAVVAMRSAQSHGVDLLWLRFPGSGRAEGIQIVGAEEIEELVAAVRPGTAVMLDAGADAATMVDRWTVAARDGELEHTPAMGAALVSVTRYHDAGATAVQELAFALASGVEILRRAAGEAIDADTAASRIQFSFSIGRNFFGEIAKLRAARLLWSKVVRGAGGGEAAQAAHIHARTSGRETAVYDPWMNMLRGGSQGVAAVLGGADSIRVVPAGETLGMPDEVSARLAANVQHILAEEAHLGRVADAAGGSWYLESLTDGLARAAWALFQDLERRGGMARCLEDGEIARLLRASADELRRAAATRCELLIGVSAFANLAEPAPKIMPESGAAADAFEPVRLAAPFEELRAAGDRWLAEHGERPSATVLALDSAAGTDVSAAFVRRVLAVAGIEAVLTTPETVFDERSTAVVICGQDVSDPAVAADWVTRLRRHGATRVLLAGESDEAPGVDDLIADGCDVPRVLRDLLEALGVLA